MCLSSSSWIAHPVQSLMVLSSCLQLLNLGKLESEQTAFTEPCISEKKKKKFLPHLPKAISVPAIMV